MSGMFGSGGPSTGELMAPQALDYAVSQGQAAQTVGTGYMTAQRVLVERDLVKVQKKFLMECLMAGETFYYRFPAGKDGSIEGPSIGMAMALARAYGNCATPVRVEETEGSYIYYAAFIDLESGTTFERPFRQSKASRVFMKTDEERKDDIRFQIGASKAIRNVILNALPKWLINQGLEKAKEGAKKRIEEYVNRNGIAKAIDFTLARLKEFGVEEQDALTKMGVADKKALDVDAIVMLSGDINAIEQGYEYAETLFATMAQRRAGAGDAVKPSDDQIDTTQRKEAMNRFFGGEKPEAKPEANKGAEPKQETKRKAKEPPHADEDEAGQADAMSDLPALPDEERAAATENPLGVTDQAIYLPLAKPVRDKVKKAKTTQAIDAVIDEYCMVLESDDTDDEALRAQQVELITLATKMGEEAKEALERKTAKT